MSIRTVGRGIPSRAAWGAFATLSQGITGLSMAWDSPQEAFRQFPHVRFALFLLLSPHWRLH